MTAPAPLTAQDIELIVAVFAVVLIAWITLLAKGRKGRPAAGRGVARTRRRGKIRVTLGDHLSDADIQRLNMPRHATARTASRKPARITGLRLK